MSYVDGVQMATTQLPLLQLVDCGKSLCANTQPETGRSYIGDLSGGVRFCSKLQTSRKQQPTCQKLIIKHANLKKLSLWGCSAVDVSAQILDCSFVCILLHVDID